MKNSWKSPIGIAVLAMLVRLVYWWEFLASPFHDYIILDHQYYLIWARKIAAGDWWGNAVFEQTPLYPYILGVVFRLFGEQLGVVFLGQMLVGTLTAVLIFLCARRLFDPPTAIFAGILTAVYGPLLYYECLVMKSFLSPFLTTATLYTLLRYDEVRRTRSSPASQGGGRWLVLSGLTIGLACLVRENHVLLVLPAVFWIWSCERSQGMRYGRVASRLTVLCLTVGLCLLPSTIRNAIEGDEFVVVTSGGGEVFYMGHGPDADGFFKEPDFVTPNPFSEHEDFRKEAERRLRRKLTRGEASRYWSRQARNFVWEHPGRSFILTGKKLLILLNDFEVSDSENFTATRRMLFTLQGLPTFGWIGALGLLGMGRCVWRRQGRAAGISRPVTASDTQADASGSLMLSAQRLAIGLIGVHVVSVLLTYNFSRHRLGMMPLWCLFAAYGAVWLVRQWRTNAPHSPPPDKGRRVGRGRIRAALWTVVVAAFTATMFLPPIGYAKTTYSIDTEMLLGRMNCRAENFPAAEEHFRTALRHMGESESTGPSRHAGNQQALLAQRIGDILNRHGQRAQAARFYRDAVSAPNAPEFREILLRHWMQILVGWLDAPASKSDTTKHTAELRRVLKELRQITPHEIAYWALSAEWAEDAESARRYSDGLDRGWTGSSDRSPAVASTYWVGKAFAAEAMHNRQAARDAARRALQFMPNHPRSAEMRNILKNSDAD